MDVSQVSSIFDIDMEWGIMVRETFYTKYIKGLIDRVFGILGLIGLSWLFLLIAVAIYVDDPGPILFKQRRIGKNQDGKKTYFEIYKFRTMKVSTPELPTHLLENPEQYITRVGRVLRKTSMDELPQLWNIGITHSLALIGPRPGLWSQDNLWEEREKYGANDVMPGLTGWAQINGRDELEIEDKARLDGEYVQNMSFIFDVKCFVETIFSVLRSDGVVEGGTGSLKKRKGTRF